MGTEPTSSSRDSTVNEAAERQIGLQERLWQQLLEFSDQYYAVTEYLVSHPNAELDEISEQVQLSFPSDRLAREFLSHLQTLLERHRVIRDELNSAPELYGAKWQEKLFEKWTGVHPIGKITILPDPNALIFICDKADNFATSYAGESGPGIPQIKRMHGSHDSQCRTKNSAGEWIEAGVVVVNAEAADDAVSNGQRTTMVRQFLTKKDAAVQAVIAHERQHVINQLFVRPYQGESETYKKLHVDYLNSAIVPGFLSIPEELLDRARNNGELTSELLQEIEQRVIQATNKLYAQLATLLEPLAKHAEENTIKEEVLAFYLSDTLPDEIVKYLPNYVQKCETKVFDLIAIFRFELNKKLPKEVIEALGIVPSMSSSAEIDESALHERATQIANDWVSEQCRDIENQLTLMGSTLTEKAGNAIAQLERLLPSKDALPSKELRTVMPILVTHPLSRWPWIVDQALRYGQAKG